MSEVNAVRGLLQVEQLSIGAGSRCAGPGSTMVSQLQYRSPGQGAPHQPPKKVAARGVTIAADNVIVRMNVPVWMDVTLRMRVAVRMRPAILRCIGQRSSCRFRHARFLAGC